MYLGVIVVVLPWYYIVHFIVGSFQARTPGYAYNTAPNNVLNPCTREGNVVLLLATLGHASLGWGNVALVQICTRCSIICLVMQLSTAKRFNVKNAHMPMVS